MTILAGALAWSFQGDARRIHLPGPTTNGHYQIELKCEVCHSTSFADRDVLQAACVECHGSELKQANDSHPETKFTDPRNANRVKVLDARFCVTCHREHRPELVSEMGLSLPEDYCFRCHEHIGEERKSHAGLGFETCADKGCHNFHDNRALYEDYLIKHLDDPDHTPEPENPARSPAKRGPALTAKDADAPRDKARDARHVEEWSESAHARGGVNCSDCHGGDEKGAGFSEHVSQQRCAGCHEQEHAGYILGKHGMREVAGLDPMRVLDARLPMRQKAQKASLSCASCHRAHRFDTRKAAVQACLGCHDDEHSRNYEASPHARLFSEDESGLSGASCATCHLPRIVEGESVRVLHNQNDTLRPSEKMVRPVCTNCHGVGFALAALADEELVRTNFKGRPRGESTGIEMVRARSHGFRPSGSTAH